VLFLWLTYPCKNQPTTTPTASSRNISNERDISNDQKRKWISTTTTFWMMNSTPKPTRASTIIKREFIPSPSGSQRISKWRYQYSRPKAKRGRPLAFRKEGPSHDTLLRNRLTLTQRCHFCAGRKRQTTISKTMAEWPGTVRAGVRTPMMMNSIRQSPPQIR
jgi:hypothetical protein